MLRKIRTRLALLMMIGITGLFLDFTGCLHTWLGWMAKIQFLPALLALHVAVVVALVALTLIFGRIYCSVICPLGILQDGISWLSGRRKKKRFRFSYSPAKSWLRYVVLALFVVALIAGIGSLVALLAPYSAYGRMVHSLLMPLYVWANNLLAGWAERAGSYAIYSREVWLRSLATTLVAAGTLVILFVLAWRHGRTYCNTICPVGTVLGFLSRFAWLKVHILEEKCINCGLCARSCKASCIDAKNHRIDYSRCVACGNCLEKCHTGALVYRHAAGETLIPKSAEPSRRAFLVGAALASTAAAMAQRRKKVDGGLALIEQKVAPERSTPITPPGSLSAKHMAQHCTACQLCVTACPNDVLRPSTDLMKLMQPTASYERGYCRPECTRCSEVCPAGAIQPISRAEKSSIQIGHAVWIKANCIPLTDGVSCGNCARHCPAGAITMVPSDSANPDSPKIPAVDETRCIGCGACENLCPARPFSAIYVEGHEVHRYI